MPSLFRQQTFVPFGLFKRKKTQNALVFRAVPGQSSCKTGSLFHQRTFIPFGLFKRKKNNDKAENKNNQGC